MSLDPRAWRPSPLLPPSPAVGRLCLFLAAALTSLVAVMAMTWLSADLRARPALLSRLGGGATIAILAPRTPGDLESLDAAAWRAREILAATPGVASAQVLEPAAGDEAIAAAMGAGRAPSRLIALGFAPGAASATIPTMGALIGALSREGLAGAGDDHNPVTGPVERAITLDIAGLALAGIVLCGVFAGLVGAMIHARAGRMAARITLLSGLGMTDPDLLTRLLAPVVLNAGLASITGGVAALAIMGLAAPSLPGLELVTPAPGAVDLLRAAAWPALAVSVVLMAAMLVGLGRIRRLAP